MRVTCPHCLQKARITSSNNMTENGSVRELYCQCLNTQHCGSSFVFTLSLKHTLNPPYNSIKNMAIQVIKSLPSDQRKQAQVDLFG